MNLFIRWLLSAVALLIVTKIIPGFSVDSLWSALVAAFLLGLANAVVKPVLIILTLPITLLTLGFFLLVINALMILLVSSIVKGFDVAGFAPAFWGSIVLWLVSLAMDSLLKTNAEN